MFSKKLSFFRALHNFFMLKFPDFRLQRYLTSTIYGKFLRNMLLFDLKASSKKTPSWSRDKLPRALRVQKNPSCVGLSSLACLRLPAFKGRGILRVYLIAVQRKGRPYFCMSSYSTSRKLHVKPITTCLGHKPFKIYRITLTSSVQESTQLKN